MNKRAKRSLYLIGFLILVYILQQIGLLNHMIAYIGDLPFWVVLVITGILISFWQFMKYSDSEEEEEADEKWIEEQGSVFIRRMQEEKERRNKKTSSHI
ncbi:MAG: sporulation YhaL family protein [Tuberibacillus sp.]